MAPNGKVKIHTPSEGYRQLAADVICPVIEAINRGRQVEYNLGILMSERNRKWLQLLGWNPENVIEQVLQRNGLEITNGKRK